MKTTISESLGLGYVLSREEAFDAYCYGKKVTIFYDRNLTVEICKKKALIMFGPEFRFDRFVAKLGKIRKFFMKTADAVSYLRDKEKQEKFLAKRFS